MNADAMHRLTDSFARAGYISVAPDLFAGKPAPNDINVPGFNTTQFLAAHGPNVTDPIIANAVKYLKEELGVSKVAVTGYCFGGRYAFRELAEGKGANVAFAAHPSLLTDDEIKAITGPASVAAARTSLSFPNASVFDMRNASLTLICIQRTTTSCLPRAAPRSRPSSARPASPSRLRCTAAPRMASVFGPTSRTLSRSTARRRLSSRQFASLTLGLKSDSVNSLKYLSRIQIRVSTRLSVGRYGSRSVYDGVLDSCLYIAATFSDFDCPNQPMT